MLELIFGVGTGEARPKWPRVDVGFLGVGHSAAPHQQVCGSALPSEVRAELWSPRSFLTFCATRLPLLAPQYVRHAVQIQWPVPPRSTLHHIFMILRTFIWGTVRHRGHGPLALCRHPVPSVILVNIGYRIICLLLLTKSNMF